MKISTRKFEYIIIENFFCKNRCLKLHAHIVYLVNNDAHIVYLVNGERAGVNDMWQAIFQTKNRQLTSFWEVGHQIMFTETGGKWYFVGETASMVKSNNNVDWKQWVNHRRKKAKTDEDSKIKRRKRWRKRNGKEK